MTRPWPGDPKGSPKSGPKGSAKGKGSGTKGSVTCLKCFQKMILYIFFLELVYDLWKSTSTNFPFVLLEQFLTWNPFRSRSAPAKLVAKSVPRAVCWKAERVRPADVMSFGESNWLVTQWRLLLYHITGITLLRSNVSPPKAFLKMIFLFQRWDMDSFPGGYIVLSPKGAGLDCCPWYPRVGISTKVVEVRWDVLDRLWSRWIFHGFDWQY